MIEESENFMKTLFGNSVVHVAVLALCATALSVRPSFAQDNPAPQQDQAGPAQAGRNMPGNREEHQLDVLTKKLNLTPDQVTQVKAIDDDSRQQMMSVRNDSSIAKPDKRAKMMDIRKASQDKIRGVLTDEQKPKYDAMQAKMQEHRANRQNEQGATPPSAPQQ